MTELAGPHWRVGPQTLPMMFLRCHSHLRQIHHGIVSPHAPTANNVTASTPLPKPKPIHSLRHSVSFSNTRSGSKLHHRRSSNLELAASSITLPGMALQSVKEVGEADNNTPTGALKRLCVNSSTELKGMGQDTRKAKKELEDVALVKTPKLNNDLTLVEKCAFSKATPCLKSCDVDHEKLGQILGILSSLDPGKLLALNAGPCAEPHGDEKAARMRKQESSMLRRMLDEQEKRLNEREGRLKWMAEMVRAEKGKYDSRSC